MTTKALSAASAAISDVSLATAKAVPAGASMLVGDTVVTFPNDGNTLLIFHAGAGTTIQPQAKRGSSPTAITLSSGSTYIMGPYDRGTFNNAAGLCTVNLGTGNASHTAAVAWTTATEGKPGSRHNPFRAPTSTAQDA